MFEALADDSALRIRPLLRQVRLEATSFDEFVEKTFLTLFEYMLADRAYFDVMRRNSGTIRVRMDTPEIIAGLNEFQEDLEEAMAQGLVPKVDAEYLTTAMAGVAFDLSDRALERDPPDVAGAAKFASSLILRGIDGFRDKKASPEEKSEQD